MGFFVSQLNARVRESVVWAEVNRTDATDSNIPPTNMVSRSGTHCVTCYCTVFGGTNILVHYTYLLYISIHIATHTTLPKVGLGICTTRAHSMVVHRNGRAGMSPFKTAHLWRRSLARARPVSNRSSRPV